MPSATAPEPEGSAATIEASGDRLENGSAEDEAPGVRRSTRSRKRTARFVEENDEDELASAAAPAKPEQQRPVKTARRNPPRKAAAAIQAYALPDNLLEEAISTVRDDERDAWQGWVELESEPAFFNAILRDLGVRDVKIQELFGVDEGSMGYLPKPVHGLIFLYQYTEDTSSKEDKADSPNGIWFANQITDNACATIALMNIVMNGDGLELGEQLQTFKAATRDLASPIRGYALSTNSFIRNIHNTCARRFDLLNADLLLQNAFDDAKAKKKRRVAGRRSRKRNHSEAAFHFIAYVPVDGKVWELDGLEARPACLGAFEGDWTAVVRPIIESRMLQYEEDSMSFNLLALCRSPVLALREEMAANVRKLQSLDELAKARGWTGTDGSAAQDQADGANEEQALARLGLGGEDVAGKLLDERFKAAIAEPGFGAPDAAAMQQELKVEQRRIVSEYTGELGSAEEDEARFLGRKKDYTPAIHDWIKKLAEHGAMQELVEEAAQ